MTAQAGRGTNQYAKRGASRGRSPQTVADARAAIEAEAAAWAFAGDDVPEERMDPTVATRMAAHPSFEVREKAAAAPCCPPAVLALLVEDEDTRLELLVAANRSCPPDTARMLAHRSLERPDAALSSVLAESPSSPPEVFDILFGEVDPDVDVVDPSHIGTSRREFTPKGFIVTAVMKAAENPSCPPAHLRRIAFHPYNTHKVAANPACPTDLFMWLAADRQGRTHIAALKNPSCPTEVLRAAVERPRGQSAASALMNPNCPPDLVAAAVEDRRLVKLTSDSPALPGDLCGQVAMKFPDSLAARRFGSDPTADPEMLGRLAGRVLNAVTAAKLARNPSLPRKGLVDLSHRGSMMVDRALAQNPSTPQSVLRRFARRKGELEKVVRARPDYIGK